MTWTQTASIKGATGATGPAATITAANVGQNWYAVPYISGNYYMANSLSKTNTGTLGTGGAAVTPWVVTSTITLASLFVEVTGSASSSSVRIGVWADDGYCRPSTLILDAGTVSSTTNGVKEITGLSTTLTAGMYWVGAASQGGNPNLLLVHAYGPVAFHQPLGTSLPTTAGLATLGWSQTGVTSSLGAWTGTTPTTVAPRIGFKVT